MHADYQCLSKQIETRLRGEQDEIALMATLASEVHHADDRFDWTGFYRVTAPRLLKIGPYQGRPGALAIPFDSAPCGVCACRGEVQFAECSAASTAPMAGSAETRSHIALPVTDSGGRLIAVFTLASAQPAAFTQTDATELSAILRHAFTDYGAWR